MLLKLSTPSTNSICRLSFFQAWVKETQCSQLRFCCGHHYLRSSEVDQNVFRIVKTSMKSKNILKENQMHDCKGGLEQSIERTLTNDLFDIKGGLLHKYFHRETSTCTSKTAEITRINRIYDGTKKDFSRIKERYVRFEQNSICRNQCTNHKRENINGLSKKVNDNINKESTIPSFRTQITIKGNSCEGSKIGNACDTALIAKPIDIRTKSIKYLAKDKYNLTLKSGHNEIKCIADKENDNVTKKNPVSLKNVNDCGKDQESTKDGIHFKDCSNDIDGRKEDKLKAYTVNLKCKAKSFKNIKSGIEVQRAIGSTYNRSADSSKDMDDGKDMNSVEKDLDLPEEPTTCCMSGCANCVWIEYAEKLNELFSGESEKTKRIILEKIKDPNMKAFLQMELEALVKKNKGETW